MNPEFLHVPFKRQLTTIQWYPERLSWWPDFESPKLRRSAHKIFDYELALLSMFPSESLRQMTYRIKRGIQKRHQRAVDKYLRIFKRGWRRTESSIKLHTTLLRSDAPSTIKVSVKSSNVFKKYILTQIFDSYLILSCFSSVLLSLRYKENESIRIDIAQPLFQPFKHPHQQIHLWTILTKENS